MISDTTKQFGEWIRKIRKDMGWDQQTIADEMGITRQSVSLYEKGLRTPNLDIAIKYIRIAGYIPDCIEKECNKKRESLNSYTPAVNALCVTRCGECIYSPRPFFQNLEYRYCTLMEKHRRLDYFCADGRRDRE